jgi:hypothetical protein
MVLRRLGRLLRLLALVLTAVAALFGVPLIIDPPPGDRTVEVGEADSRRKRRRRRS